MLIGFLLFINMQTQTHLLTVGEGRGRRPHLGTGTAPVSLPVVVSNTSHSLQAIPSQKERWPASRVQESPQHPATQWHRYTQGCCLHSQHIDHAQSSQHTPFYRSGPATFPSKPICQSAQRTDTP